MEQKLKELLVKDLCARLPYGVKCMISDDKEFPQDKTIVEELTPSGYKAFIDTMNCSAVNPFFVKPYLRPMSSMTDKEREEWYRQSHVDYDPEYKPDPTLSLDNCYLSIDWLIAHHFDYRGLIPIGIALEAPDNMYK